MSNTVEEPAATPQGASATNPLGAVLSAARERHRLSIEDVSGHLRLSPRQIMALENDDFSALPEAMITRGFIRNYARLLEIDAEPLLQAYRSYAPSAETYRISIDSANIPIESRNQRPWKIYVVVSLVIAALVGLWVLYVDFAPRQSFSSFFGSAEQASTPENSAAQVPMPVETGGGYVPPPETQADAPAATSEVAADTATQDAATDTSSAAAVSAPTLKFSFSGTSWVSVTDADNMEILNKTKPAGSEETVQGKPPFRIVIGNASGTQLVYNDKTIDLGDYTSLNVARLTLE